MTVSERGIQMQKMQKTEKKRARNAAAVETGDWITVKEGETNFL